MKTYLYRASNLKSTITFLAFNSKRNSISGAREKPVFLAIYLSESTNQYKLPVNFFTNPTSGGSL